MITRGDYFTTVHKPRLGGVGGCGCVIGAVVVFVIFHNIFFFLTGLFLEIMPIALPGLAVLCITILVINRINESERKKWHNLEELRKDISETESLLEERGLLNNSNKKQISLLAASLHELRDSMNEAIAYKNRIISDSERLAIEPLVKRGVRKDPRFEEALNKVDDFYNRKQAILKDVNLMEKEFESEKKNASLFLSEIRIRATVDQGSELSKEFARHIRQIENARELIVANINMDKKVAKLPPKK